MSAAPSFTGQYALQFSSTADSSTSTQSRGLPPHHPKSPSSSNSQAAVDSSHFHHPPASGAPHQDRHNTPRRPPTVVIGSSPHEPNPSASQLQVPPLGGFQDTSTLSAFAPVFQPTPYSGLSSPSHSSGSAHSHSPSSPNRPISKRDREAQYLREMDEVFNEPADSRFKLFVGGLSWNTTDAGFTKFFEQFGPVEEAMIMRDRVTGKSRGFGFVTFKEQYAVDMVLRTELLLDGRKIDPKHAVPRQETHRAKVFIGGLPQDATQRDLFEYFSKHGRVNEALVKIDHKTGRSRGFGFVTFLSENAVDSVLRQANHFIRGKAVECKKATPKAKTPLASDAPSSAVISGSSTSPRLTVRGRSTHARSSSSMQGHSTRMSHMSDVSSSVLPSFSPPPARERRKRNSLRSASIGGSVGLARIGFRPQVSPTSHAPGVRRVASGGSGPRVSHMRHMSFGGSTRGNSGHSLWSSNRVDDDSAWLHSSTSGSTHGPHNKSPEPSPPRSPQSFPNSRPSTSMVQSPLHMASTFPDDPNSNAHSPVLLSHNGLQPPQPDSLDLDAGLSPSSPHVDRQGSGSSNGGPVSGVQLDDQAIFEAVSVSQPRRGAKGASSDTSHQSHSPSQPPSSPVAADPDAERKTGDSSGSASAQPKPTDSDDAPSTTVSDFQWQQVRQDTKLPHFHSTGSGSAQDSSHVANMLVATRDPVTQLELTSVEVLTGDVASWTTATVLHWLLSVDIGLYTYGLQFLSAGIDGAMLLSLTDRQLQGTDPIPGARGRQIKVRNADQRAAILEGIAALRACQQPCYHHHQQKASK